MADPLTITAVRGGDLSEVTRAAVIALCAEAYDESFDRLFEELPGSVHVLGQVGARLVSHAAWVTRWLRPQGYPLLRTAYVEAVATRPAYQQWGYASAVLRAVCEQIGEYDLGALSPSAPAFYERLGQERWQGRLAIRTARGLLPTPDDSVMILRLERTPAFATTGQLTAEWRVGELW